jgi:hypothetical protein
MALGGRQGLPLQPTVSVAVRGVADAAKVLASTVNPKLPALSVRASSVSHGVLGLKAVIAGGRFGNGTAVMLLMTWN